MKKFLVLVMSLLLVFSVLTGCANGGSSESSTASNATSGSNQETSATTSVDEAVELNFMSIFVETDVSTDIATKAKYAQIDKFLNDYPNVKVVNNSISQTDYNTKIKAIVAADDLPDIWTTRGYSMCQAAVDGDRLYTADEIMAQVDGWKEMFTDGVFGDFLYKDEYWAVPVQLQGCTYLFCNMDILKSLGIDKAPATWDELIAAVKASKEAGYTPLASGNKDKYPIADCVASWLNDRYCTTEWFTSIGENTGARWTDDCFVQALTAFNELVKLGAFNADANSLDQDQGYAYYANKEAAMMFSGAWGCEWIEGNCSDEIINASVCVVPPEIAGTPGVQNGAAGGGGWGYVVTKDVKDAQFQAASNLIYYLTNLDYTAESLAVGYCRYPSKTPEGADLSLIGPVTKQYLETVPNTTWTPDYTVLTEASTLEVYQNMYQELLVGMVTPEEAAKQIDEAYQMYLDTLK